MTSDAFFSFFNFHLHSIRTLNPKSNPKQTQPRRPTLLLVTKNRHKKQPKTKQLAKKKNAPNRKDINPHLLILNLISFSSPRGHSIQPQLSLRPIRQKLTVAFGAVNTENFRFTAKPPQPFFKLTCTTMGGEIKMPILRLNLAHFSINRCRHPYPSTVSQAFQESDN